MSDLTRKRTGKFLMYAQVPIIIFSVFIFSQVRTTFGATPEDQNKIRNKSAGGFNMDLPEPVIGNALDKLSLIERAREDSIKKAKDSKSDFGIFNKSSEEIVALDNADRNRARSVEELQAKLDQVNAELDNRNTAPTPSTSYGNSYSYEDFKAQQKEKELQKMEGMVAHMEQTGLEGANEELDDVNQTMDKMVKVMEMARAMEEGRSLESELSNQPGEKRNVLEVKKVKDGFSDSNSNQFNELEDYTDYTSMDNTFKASFFTEQTLMSGSTVKIKLDEDLFVNEMTIPKNTFLYGKVGLSGDRLRLTITSIKYKEYLFPVSLVAYDYDGMEGIHVPGSIERDLAKKETSTSIRSMDFTTMSFDQTVEDKAIESGSNFVKDLFSRKVRLVKVKVKPHHKILLKNK